LLNATHKQTRQTDNDNKQQTVIEPNRASNSISRTILCKQRFPDMRHLHIDHSECILYVGILARICNT